MGDEHDAIMYGGQMGGEYLDSINITDLAALTPEQWQTFLEVVCLNYHNRTIEHAGRREILCPPF